MKRIFSILLVFSLLFALAVPASAAESDFTDAADIRNINEVTMLYDLGIISGYSDGSFCPDGTITRQEIAKLVALILDASPIPTDPSPYSDVTEETWGYRFILYCSENGIFSGNGNGTFRPDDTITARELAKVLLCAIGRSSDRYSGDGWEDAVDEDAEALGIYAGFTGRRGNIITRDNACLLIFNALQCNAISGWEDGEPVYYTDELLNPVTVLEHRFGVTEYSETVVANEYADLTGETTALAAGKTKLDGHLPLPVSTPLEMVGRNAVLFVQDGQVIGIPYYSPTEVYFTFRSFAEYRKLLSATIYHLSSDTKFYVNYKAATLAALGQMKDNDIITIIDHENDGIIDEVLMVSYSSATVTDTFPLTLSDSSGTLSTGPFVNAPNHLEIGQTVSVAEIGGRYYFQD